MSTSKLKITMRTWCKDSYGLYDHEAGSNILRTNFTITNSGTFLREDNDIVYYPKKDNKNNDSIDTLTKFDILFNIYL